jgi:alcohol dehydrogenase, propanol-preferring
MRAVRLRAWQAEPEFEDVPVPSPGPGEVLVAVESAGLCHSDLDIMGFAEGTMPWQLPFTLGHETAGTVVALGPGASGFDEGDRVLLAPLWGCGACRHCAGGADNRCLVNWERRGGGLGADGGLAEFVLVPSTRPLVRIDGLDPASAAPLADAGLTPYHALRPHLPIRPGASVVVIGVGGLGHVAIQLLRSLTPARIVAVDLRHSARDLALDAGAHVAIDPTEAEAADVRLESGAEGAALVLDFVGSDDTVALACSVVEMGGHVTIVGRGGGTLPTAAGLLPLEWSASRPSAGTVAELREVVELARAGVVELELERLALDEALDGYRRLREGTIVGRAVVTP